MLDIADRRNELSGNLSLYQELHVIEKIDQLLADGLLIRATGTSTSRCASSSSTAARRRGSSGPHRSSTATPGSSVTSCARASTRPSSSSTALAFERAWRRKDVDGVRGFPAPRRRADSIAPFRPHAGLRGSGLQEVLSSCARDVRMDLTRKQLTRDRATWTVRIDGAADRRGRVEAEIVDGRVSRLRLGPATSA